MSRDHNGFIGGIIAAVIIFIGLIVFFTGMTKVPAGYIAVKYEMNGGISDDTLSQGWHWTSPTVKTTLYSIGIEQSYLTKTEDGDSPRNDSFEVPSLDGKALDVDLTFTYRYDADKVADIFTRFKGRSGKEVKDIFIKPNIISKVKEVTARYPVTDILGDKRAEINSVLTDYIREYFDAYGIIIENVSLIDIAADDETRAAIQKKVTAQQDLELSRIEKQTAEVNAEKEKQVALIKANQDKETAAIEAEQKVIKANAEAEATRIKAQAQAEANKAIAESLTTELIQKSLIDKWKGEVPKIWAGGAEGIMPILDIEQLK